MGEAWGQILGPIIGAGMGLALEDHNQYMQQRQQQELGQIQVNQTEQLQKNSMDLQYDMWNKTNYSAQVAQLQKAGLNPALLYAKGGPGGMTGSPTGSVSGATAQQNPGEVQQMAGLGLQLAAQLRLLNAQKNNIDADTQLKQEQAAKTAGVDTQQGFATISELQARTHNEAEQAALTRINQDIAKFDLNLKDQTLDDSLKTIHANANAAIDNARKMESEANVAGATVDDAIKTIKAEAIGAVLRNTLTKTQTNLGNEQIEKLKADINLENQQFKNSIQEVMQGWDKLDQENKKIQLQKLMNNAQIDKMDWDKLTGAITDILGLGIVTKAVGKAGHNVIEGFKQKY